MSRSGLMAAAAPAAARSGLHCSSDGLLSWALSSGLLRSWVYALLHALAARCSSSGCRELDNRYQRRDRQRLREQRVLMTSWAPASAASGAAPGWDCIQSRIRTGPGSPRDEGLLPTGGCSLLSSCCRYCCSASVYPLEPRERCSTRSG